MLAPAENGDIVFQWKHWPSASITVPIRNQIVRDSIQPGSEWDTFVLIGLDMIERTLEHPGSEIFCILMISGPIIDITVDTPDMTFIKLTKSFRFAFCPSDKLHLIKSGIGQITTSREDLDIGFNTKNP
jgi:hypothetical protein